MSEQTVRLDTYLVNAGHATGREKAKELLAAGHVSVNGTPTDKASRRVSPTDRVVCTAPAPRYVGRGGFKLEKALELTGVSPEGLTAMDVGASTGGFTDCMLQHGAAHVYAVDVGHDQLHPTLRVDPRVTVLEGTDIRSDTLRSAVAADSVDFCSVDVSFVSLTAVLPAILPYLAPNATLVCLIKPQFEAGRGAHNKHGVVKDKKVHIRVLNAMLAAFSAAGLTPLALTHSPITGGEGNIEYLAVLTRRGDSLFAGNATAVVEAAFAALK